VKSGAAKRFVYHRLQGPTQPPDIVSVQQQTGRIRGYPARGSLIPKVKAYDGPLPADRRGIEFTTDLLPDDGGAPGLPTWSGGRIGIRHGIDELGREFVEIDIVIIKNTQT
jgi:hypothetical protein